MRNIVLIGFMGTGKTSTGRLLANRLGYAFVDTDYKIEKDNKMTIKDMFANFGETYFRQKEATVVQKISRQKQLVIATGGGTVLNPANSKVLRANSIVVSLTASVEVILERTGRKNTRPILERCTAGERRELIEKLQLERSSLYKQADLIIDTGDLTPLQVVEKILAFVRKDVKPRA